MQVGKVVENQRVHRVEHVLHLGEALGEEGRAKPLEEAVELQQAARVVHRLQQQEGREQLVQPLAVERVGRCAVCSNEAF